MENNGSTRIFNPYKWKVALSIMIIALIVFSMSIILSKLSTSKPSYDEEGNLIPQVTHIAKGVVIDKEDSIWKEESEIVYVANVTILVHGYAQHDWLYAPFIIRLNCEFHRPIEDYWLNVKPGPFDTIPFQINMPYEFRLQYIYENQRWILWDYMPDGWGFC